MALFTKSFTAAVGFTGTEAPAVRTGGRGLDLVAAIWAEQREQNCWRPSNGALARVYRSTSGWVCDEEERC
jgi:hypothetical protein